MAISLAYITRLLTVSFVIALSVLFVDYYVLKASIKEKLPYKDSPYMRFLVLMLEVAVGVAASRVVVRWQQSA